MPPSTCITALLGTGALDNLQPSLSTAAQFIGLAGVVGLCSGTWWLAGRYYRSRTRLAARNARAYQKLAEKSAAAEEQAQGKLAESQGALADAQADLSAAQEARHKAETARQKDEHDLAATRAQLKAADEELTARRREVEELRREVTVLRERAGVTVDDLTAKSRALARLETRMKAALKLEGQLWNARALQKRPQWRDLSQRQRAIISVLNLKGGVGKTTVAAHLGAALARRGYRVLLIDLDLQGSLTSMLLPQDKINQAFADRRLVQHFLQRAADDATVKVGDYALEVSDRDAGGSLDLIGATDNLAYAELNLTMRWLMGTGARDPRFLLRKALHLMSVSAAYDVVLIDCPPLVNISCVNALAASDYVLVPTTLSRKSLERTPTLIRKVLRNEKFEKYINPKLHVLGLVANRTTRAELTAIESSGWKQVAAWCKDAHGQAVFQFATTIPQIKDVQSSEIDFEPQGTTPRLDALFNELAAEVERELPSECRRPANAPS
jgi:cellulose biosynthesis protein BcsQ